jgi:hypothetical protein
MVEMDIDLNDCILGVDPNDIVDKPIFVTVFKKQRAVCFSLQF